MAYIAEKKAVKTYGKDDYDTVFQFDRELFKFRATKNRASLRKQEFTKALNSKKEKDDIKDAIEAYFAEGSSFWFLVHDHLSYLALDRPHYPHT